MKNLIRIFLILTIIGGAVSLHSACSDENDCSLAGRPMMYCTIYTINPAARCHREEGYPVFPVFQI